MTAAPRPRRLLLSTSNAGKVREIRELLAGTGWEAVTPRELGVTFAAPVETARSYAENAIAKAVAAAEASGLPALADDSGIEVDALDGAPGPLSARFGGPTLSDTDRCTLLLRRLEGVPPGRRGARFRAVVALALPGNRVITREGVLEGRVALAPRGANGFGYDPVFELLDGRTVAELGAEKQTLSHRARALTSMAEVLRGLG